MTSHKANYPEDSSKDSLRWMQVAKKITDGLADSWFSDFERKPVAEAIHSPLLDYDPASKVAFETMLVTGNGYEVIPEFASTLLEKNLESVIFQNSELGMKLLSSLEKLKVNFQLETRILINDEKMIELPAEVSMRIHSFWTTYFNNAFTQSAEIYRDEKGKEYCYWFAPVLYGSRARDSYDTIEVVADVSNPSEIYEIVLSEEEKTRGVLDFGKWSTTINLPWLSKCLFYLGETPFPSSMLSMGREMAFQGLKEGQLPTPYMRFVEHEEMHTHGSQKGAFGNNESLFLPVIAPQQIQMGWFFSQEDFESHEIILTTITTALIKIMSYLEDGYFNFGNQDSAWPFHAVLFSDFQLDVEFSGEGPHSGYSQWIPSTAVFEQIDETRRKIESLSSSFRSESSKREEIMRIMETGVGKPFVGAATNDAIFTYLLAEKEWDAIDWYAERLKKLEVPLQTTNALSNWGISKYLQGDYEAATDLFLQALARSDGFAEDEASFYLAEINKKLGNSKESAEYLKRCQSAGGYEPTYL